jgi:putative ATPase
VDLFDSAEADEAPKRAGGAGTPLADRMRPRTLAEFVGQEEIAGANAPLRRLIAQDRMPSMIFWGPPGSGKTTLAHIIARQTKSVFTSMSAVTASIKDVKAIMERARIVREREGRRTILFIDEIHRFNKAQQDAFLPFVEEGSIILIGATTENPSFSVISALLSRCRIFVLRGLTREELVRVMEAALADPERGMGSMSVEAPEAILLQVADLADGDARRALNLLELTTELTPPGDDGVRRLGSEQLKQVLQRQHLLYDKTGEEHFNTISALHKSLRGSDVQGAIYWAQRMLSSGEDPLYLARRLIRFASEDIGNADPQALHISLAAREAYSILGTPEGELAIIQCVIYLATAPKSNAAYVAHGAVRAEIDATGSLPVPLHIRNAPTGLMKELGYGRNYQYEHDHEDQISGQTFLPDGLKRTVFYEPGGRGFEAEIRRRLEIIEKRRAERRGEKKE